jgi:hypothetical protein
MTSPSITADQAPAAGERNELQVELPAGVDEVSYPRGVKIKEVKLKGMRNKPVPLTRRPWEEIVQMNQFTRGVPDRYAIEYRQHLIRVWPAARTNLTLIVDRADPGKGEADAVALIAPSVGGR